MRAILQRPPNPLWPRVILSWLAILLPLLLLGALSEDVWERESFRFDAPTLLWLHAHSGPWLDGAMLWMTRIGGVPLLGAGALWALLLGVRKRGRDALFVIGCVGGAGILNLAAKLVFARVRPDLWISLAPETDYGFPSGHAMLSSAFVGAALVLVWQNTKSPLPRRLCAVLGVLFVAAVGLSRLYLGVHFPTDILAGWLASIAWGALLRNLFFKA